MSSQRLAYPAYRSAEALARLLPEPALGPVARLGGTVAAAVMPGRRRTTQSHVQRVAGRRLPRREQRRRARAVFVSYADYWLDTFRLSATGAAELNRRVHVSRTDLARIDSALSEGRGAVLATPHFGSWDLGGAWLAQQGYPVTAVAERLRPQRLADLFVRIRSEFGMEVVVKSPDVWEELDAAMEANRVVVLVSDRDPRGRGAEVSFFGEETTLPTGPGRLAFRHRAPVFPVVLVGVGGRRHVGVVGEEMRAGGPEERPAVEELTQELATSFERLIRRAPEQWHLLQPNWPSDP